MGNNVKSTLEKIQKRLINLSGYLVLGLIVTLAISLIRSVIKIKEVNLRIKQKQEAVEKVEKENEELRQRLEIAKSDEFIEKQLRDKLGLAKEGEIVLILPEEEILRKLAPKYEEEEETLPDPNWKKWAKLFGLF